jgi:O-antigen/teichoic acid export membrane protein
MATLARGSSLNLLGIVGTGAATLGLLVVVSRGLGAGGGGAFFEAMALFNIAIVAAAAGSDTGLVRFVARFRGLGQPFDMRHLLEVALIPVALLGAAVAGAGLVLAGPLGEALGGATHVGEITDFLRVLAVFVPIGAVYVAVLGASRGFETMLPTVVVDRLGKPILQFGTVLVAVTAGATATVLAAGWAVVIAAALVVASAWVRRLDLRNRRPSASRGATVRLPAWEFWSFTLPRALAAIFRVAILWSDVVIVGALMSPRAAGIYAVSTRLLQFGAQIADAVGQATEPMFSRVLARGDTHRVQDLYQVATGWVVAATWPQYLAALIFATPLLRIFGSDFTEGAAAVVILAASAMVGSGMGPVDVLLVMAGKSMWSFWNTAASLTVNVVLNLALIPAWGLRGAAVAWATSRVLANLLPLLQVRAHLRVHPFGRGWRAAALAALVAFGGAGLAVRGLLGASLPGLVVFGAVALAGYGFLVRRLRDDLSLEALRRVVRNREAVAP